MGLDDAVKLLYDVELVHIGGKVFDDPGRQRIDDSELEDGYGIAEYLFYILVAGTRADDARFRSADLHTVERTCLGQLRDFAGALLDKGMTADRVGRRHDIFLRILFISGKLTLDSFLQLHSRL